MNIKLTGIVNRQLFVLLFTLIIASFSTLQVQADELGEPSGRVLLEISGDIKQTNSDGVARFDYEMLQELGLIEVSINTPWTPEGTAFEGVLSRKLFELLGASGTEIVAEAADGYAVKIPFEDLTQFDTLLALSMDGKRMRLRNKGPVWILYSNSNRPDVLDSTINSRSVWQLKKLIVQ